MTAQEYIPEEQIPAGKVYKDKAVWVAAYLGGPLTAGYLIAENYKAFGERRKARNSWIAAIVVLAVIVGMVFFVPFAERIPSAFFAILYAGTGSALVQIYQGEKIRTHIRAGGKFHSWYRAIAVTIVGMIITAVPILGINYALAYVADANETIKTYGTLNHEIGFNKSDISEAEADAIAHGFEETAFFNDAAKKAIYVRKVGNDYEVLMSFDRAILKDEPSLEFYRRLRGEMQKLFPNNKIVFAMVDRDIDDVIKRIE